MYANFPITYACLLSNYITANFQIMYANSQIICSNPQSYVLIPNHVWLLIRNINILLKSVILFTLPQIDAIIFLIKSETQVMLPYLLLGGINVLKITLSNNIRTRILGGQWRHIITVIYGNGLTVYIHIWQICDFTDRQLFECGY